MTRRICLAMLVGLLGWGALALAQGITLEMTVSPTDGNLGEPFAVMVRIINGTAEPLFTSDVALTNGRMWPFLELVLIDEDGNEIPVASDRPTFSPAPASLWMDREGEQVAVRPAVRLLPGQIVEIPIVNLLRYFPLVDPGNYRLSMTYELPIFEETIQSANPNNTDFVVLDDAVWQSIGTASAEFSVILSPDITGADLAWFRDARIGMLGIGCGDDVVSVFATPPLDAGGTIQACSMYWIGEAYELFWMLDEAITAYEAVIETYPTSLFAAYAIQRAAALKANASP